MKLVKTFGRGKAAAQALIEALERRGSLNTSKVEKTVTAIVTDVRKRGDAALRKYAAKFDGLEAGRCAAGFARGDEGGVGGDGAGVAGGDADGAGEYPGVRGEAKAGGVDALRSATGVTTGQIVRPLESVGCYVPGGRYPLPSTLLMTVTPAQVAGVERIVVCSPKPARETMAAAWLAGVTEFYRVGGAQAIAAMAYGTGSGKTDDCAGEQDCGAGESVCDRGEADGVGGVAGSICRRGRRRLW